MTLAWTRKPLPRRSAKKSRRDAEWAKTSRRILAERRYCEAIGLTLRAITERSELGLTDQEVVVLREAVARCAGHSQDVHHVVQRSLGGTDDEPNLLALCRAHHAWAHDNIALAIQVGLLAHSWGES